MLVSLSACDRNGDVSSFALTCMVMGARAFSTGGRGVGFNSDSRTAPAGSLWMETRVDLVDSGDDVGDEKDSLRCVAGSLATGSFAAAVFGLLIAGSAAAVGATVAGSDEATTVAAAVFAGASVEVITAVSAFLVGTCSRAILAVSVPAPWSLFAGFDPAGTRDGVVVVVDATEWSACDSRMGSRVVTGGAVVTAGVAVTVSVLTTSAASVFATAFGSDMIIDPPFDARKLNNSNTSSNNRSTVAFSGRSSASIHTPSPASPSNDDRPASQSAA